MPKQLLISQLKADGYRRTAKCWHGFIKRNGRVIAHSYSDDEKHVRKMLSAHYPKHEIEIQRYRTWVHPRTEEALNSIWEIAIPDTPFISV